MNGKDRKQLIWKEKPMIYPEGKCLELDLNRAPSSETTLMIKFQENLNYSGKIHLTLSDQKREYYRPDIFLFRVTTLKSTLIKLKKRFLLYIEQKYKRLKTLQKMLQQTVFLQRWLLQGLH